MTSNDFKQRPDSTEEAESLSATGMFLRAFDSSASAPSADPEAASSPAPEQPPAATPKATGPGEFTRIFQAPDTHPAAHQSLQPIQSQPVPSQPIPPQPGQSAPGQRVSAPPQVSVPKVETTSPVAPGEFTRILVSDFSVPPANVAKASVDLQPSTPPSGAPPRLKGFSSPGTSDSASAEGSFTQFFKAAPSRPAQPSQQASLSQPSAPPIPQARPIEPDPRPAELLPARSPIQPVQHVQPAQYIQQNDFPPDTYEKPSSATGMMNSFGAQGSFVPEPRQSAVPEPTQPATPPSRPEPLPDYRPSDYRPSFPPAVSPAVSAASEPGSVTQFIQRLSQEPREAPQPTPSVSIPSSDSGPGEFTRMISAGQMRQERAEAGPQPGQASASASDSFSAQSIPKVALPKTPGIGAPAITPPTFQSPGAGAAPHAPRFEMPAVTAPKLTPPALAAPQFKMPAIVPILLVVNTFLLVVLLVVVIFAMRK